MKLLKFNFRDVLIIVFTLMISHSALANVETSPESTVLQFYKAYLSDDTTNDETLTDQYVSNDLMRSINDASMCNYDSDGSVSDSELEQKCALKRECKEYKGNYLCDWHGVWVESDVNYFTKSQDVYPSWKSIIKTSLLSQNGKESRVRVVLGNGADPTLNLNVTLQEQNDDWKIISVTE